MHSDTVADITLPNLPTGFPTAALQVYVVPELHTQSLLSLGQLCDAGCTITLTSTTLTALYDGVAILHGTRTPLTRLWHVSINNSTADKMTQDPTPIWKTTIAADQHTAFVAAGGATPANLVAFHHASLGAPALSTLEKALRLNYINGFTGLTVETLRKFPPVNSIPMIKGHLDQSRKNQRSTQASNTATIIPYDDTEVPPIPPTATTSDITDDITEDSDAFPQSEPGNARTHACFAMIYDPPEKIYPEGKIYTDLTGRFITESSTGNNYLFVLYDYDSNAILCEPIKNRTKHSILAAFQVLHTKLVKAGVRPKLQRLDNECSDILKEYMTAEGIDFQLVPPHVHRRNAAERAIRTLKNHFITTLCATDPAFPLYLWDRLLPQAMLSLNLLRGSRMNPKLSAHAQLFGTFDYNRTPIAPPGTRVIIHSKPATRDSWAAHGLDGWYLGPAPESYRCYTCWVNETRRERICDTVAFLPLHVALPVATPNDMILASLKDIAVALKQPAHVDMLPPIITNQNRMALQRLMAVLDPPSILHDSDTDIHVPPLRIIHPASPTPAAPSLRVAEDQLDLDMLPSTPRRSNTTILVTTSDDPMIPAMPNLIDNDDAPILQHPPPVAIPASAPAAPEPTDAPALPMPVTYNSLTKPRARKVRTKKPASNKPVRNHHSHRTRASTGTPVALHSTRHMLRHNQVSIPMNSPYTATHSIPTRAKSQSTKNSACVPMAPTGSKAIVRKLVAYFKATNKSKAPTRASSFENVMYQATNAPPTFELWPPTDPKKKTSSGSAGHVAAIASSIFMMPVPRPLISPLSSAI